VKQRVPIIVQIRLDLTWNAYYEKELGESLTSGRAERV
jgi:hypothetical protein